MRLGEDGSSNKTGGDDAHELGAEVGPFFFLIDCFWVGFFFKLRF